MTTIASSSLNRIYLRPSMRRRYEVWFLRLGLANGEGAWWFRYLVMNPGRPGGGCARNERGRPAQLWATWFPAGGAPVSVLQGFALDQLRSAGRGASPFWLAIAGSRIEESSCVGRASAQGHDVAWDLQYRSRFAATLSDKGWIGFSRTPHSDVVFSGQVTLDGRTFRGDPLGFGLQGHNCGYRHRSLWNWTHCVFPAAGAPVTSFEALEYEMPLGMRFRCAVLWHEGGETRFRKLFGRVRDRDRLRWEFACRATDGSSVEVSLDGGGPSLHRLPYLKTDCSGTFEVSNNSLARARLKLMQPGRAPLELETRSGAVVEMAGDEIVRNPAGK